MQQVVSIRASFFVLLASLSLCACNSFFYYPDHRVYSTPDRLHIPYQRETIDVNSKIHLQSWVLSPPPSVPVKGTILHFHGNAQNRTAHYLYAAWLVDHGYRVVAFDYRGYGGSSGSPSRAGLVEDAQRMIQHTCATQQAPVFLFAQSLGGAVAVPALATLREKSCIQALIVESTFSSYRKVARSKLQGFFLTWPLQIPLSYLVSDTYSPVDFVRQLTIPLVVIHGTEDPVIPFAMGKELYDAYPNPKKELWVVPGGGHTAAFVAGDSPFGKRLVDYLHRWDFVVKVFPAL